MSDDTRGAGGRFLPGQPPKSPGRPKGARAKLGEAFLSAMQASFETHGASVIERVIQERPQDYLKVIASLQPKEMTGENGDPLFTGITVSFVKPDKK